MSNAVSGVIQIPFRLSGRRAGAGRQGTLVQVARGATMSFPQQDRLFLGHHPANTVDLFTARLGSL
jgi:hypothetical protein